MSFVVPESETPETDAVLTAPDGAEIIVHGLTIEALATLARSLERRLSLAQRKGAMLGEALFVLGKTQNELDAILLKDKPSDEEMTRLLRRRVMDQATQISLAQAEIKGHMRVEDELRRDLQMETQNVNAQIERHQRIYAEQQARIAELEKALREFVRLEEGVTDANVEECIRQCEAAGHDERLADGSLYLRAATLLATLRKDALPRLCPGSSQPAEFFSSPLGSGTCGICKRTISINASGLTNTHSYEPALFAATDRDVAEMVKRFKDGARHLRLIAGYSGEPMSTITFELSKDLDEAASILSKFSQTHPRMKLYQLCEKHKGIASYRVKVSSATLPSETVCPVCEEPTAPPPEPLPPSTSPPP